MPLILGHHRLDRWNLDDLMTKRLRIISCEAGVAAGTLLGFDRHHLIDFFDWDEGTTMTAVTRLATPTALTRSTLGTRRPGGITRGRT
jgi:hypothetical protein